MRLAAAALAGVTLVRAASDDETKGGRYAHFNGMFFMVVFVAAVFLVGKVTGALGAPSLVGEILVGVLLTNWTVLFVPRRQNLLLRVFHASGRDLSRAGPPRRAPSLRVTR